MTFSPSDYFPATYLNPVYSRSFPDPFVIKFRGEYFAYCTDFWHDGNVFGVLRSRDLVNWTEIGGALQKLPNDAPFYWAPEVIYRNGKFYMYYSVGNETLMEIRVAISARPDGGFIDCGKKLTNEDFAIDAHVFTDDDGAQYMFYATDFLAHSHIGTGTVVDKMIDFATLEGRARPVTRAKYDWQIYDPQRAEKGGVRWHTVEGAFVLKRKGTYYEMFSGGNWQNISYGVSFAVTDEIEKDEEWQQFADGKMVLPILRTVPEKVIGPGHNSVIGGLNNREMFCVYHRWTENSRALAIDRMDFAGSRIFINGATFTPQIAPFPPTFADFFDYEIMPEKWQISGEWKVSANEAISEISTHSALMCRQTAESFLCEFSLRAVETIDETGAYGFRVGREEQKYFEFLIYPDLNQAVFSSFENGANTQKKVEILDDFDAHAVQLMRVELDEIDLKISLADTSLHFERQLAQIPAQITLVAENMKAAFSGFALTSGFEDLFDRTDAANEKTGREQLSDEEICRIENRQLILSGKAAGRIWSKGAAQENFEFVANIRLVETLADDSDFGFVILNETDEPTAHLKLRGERGNFYFADDSESFKIPIPKSFAPENYHQFRFLKYGAKLFLQLEENELGALSAPPSKTKIGLYFKNATIALDMVRLTIL